LQRNQLVLSEGLFKYILKRFRMKLATGHSVEPLRLKVLPLKARQIMLLQQKCCLTTTLIRHS